MMEQTGNAVEVRGLMTALVTPFRDGEVDWACLDALLDRQVKEGAGWLVALGTTAETPTLTQAERDRVLEAVIRRAAGRCPVMAGTGSNSTAETVRRTEQAASAGASAAMVVAPYYNRPTPEGLFSHFAAVAESVDLPIVLYNVPARTGVNIANDVVVRLRDAFANIVAIKDATGSIDNVTDLRSRCDVAVLCGDDSLTWPFLALGAVGVISVIANLSPSLMKSLLTAALDDPRCATGRVAQSSASLGVGPHGSARPNKFDRATRTDSAALQIHRKVHDLTAGISRYGPNPIPIKTAMAIAGLLREEFRLPLCPLDGQARAGIEGVLRRHEMLQSA